MYNKNSVNYRKKETKASLAKKERRRNSRAKKQIQYYRNQVNKNGQHTQHITFASKGALRITGSRGSTPKETQTTST